MAEIKSEMTGVIDRVLVEVGANVEQGQDLVVIESMKSLITITSNVSGVVKEVKVGPGEFIEEGEIILALE